jgi:predicted Zn finger-like uncharacterized protein
LKISCPNCAAAYELDDSRVPAAGLAIKCPKCKSPFTVHKAADGKAAIKPGTGPLPAAGGRTPGRPITNKPIAAKKPASSAVPLPGTVEGRDPASPPAVRLPGADAAAQRPQTPAQTPVPLPRSEAPLPSPRPAPASPRGGRPAPGGALPLPGLPDAPPRPSSSGAPPRPPSTDAPDDDLALDVTSRDLAREEAAGAAVPLPGLDDAFAAKDRRGAAAAADPADPFSSIELGAPVAARPRAERPAQPPPAAPDDDAFALDVKRPDPDAFALDVKREDPDAFGLDVKRDDDAFALDVKPPAATKPLADDISFDLPEPEKPKPSRQSDLDLLDFVEDAPKDESKPSAKRPPPPMLRKSSSDMPALDLDAPPPETAPASAGEDPKKAEKARKKREQKENAAREREERALRKELRAESGESAARAKLASPRTLAIGAAALLLLVVGVLGVRARNTPSGAFWVNRLIPGKRAATAAEAKVIETGMQRLGQGDFASAREAVATGAQLLGVLPEDEEVEAFFVLAASELKLEYDQAGSDFDQAKRVVERMTATRPAQNRARAAFALASGDFAKGRQMLAGMADAANADPESTWLYAESLIRSADPQRAATVLDAALKARPGAVKLLLLRGQAAHLRGQDKEAADFFGRVLKQSPDNGRALVELAAVRESQKDPQAAQELLARALDSELRKTLDAGDEARANMIRGNLAAAAHDAKTAETAYERAVLLDPTSAAVREAYGKFRLARREWDKAARQFEAAIAAGTASAEAYAGAAAAHLGQNRLLEADKEINQAVAKEPANPHYIYLQGRVAEAIGKGDEAFKRYDAALAKKPGSVEALSAQGQMLILRGDRAKAKEKLAAALASPAQTRTALEDEAAGDLALALSDKTAAKSLFDAALALDPQDPMAHAGLGKALAAQGQTEAAKKELETALAQVDTDAGIHYEYGSVLRQLGHSDAALTALRKAVQLDGKDSRYHARLGALLVERGQFEEAEKELRQAVLIDGKNAEAQYFLGRALAGRKNLNEAIDTLHKAVNIDPDNAEYLYWMGVVYEMGQQVQDAIDSLQKSIEKNPNNADALEHLGNNLMIENRFAEAVKAYRRAAEVDAKRARLWAEVGDAEQQSGDVDGAIRDFQRALVQDGKLTGVWTKLGVAYKDKDCKGCRARAEDALQHAVQVDTMDAAAHHELGYMYKDDGKRKEAITEFQRYLDLRPDAGDVSSVQDDIYYLQEESRRAP